MRFIIYGVGAVGGSFAAALKLAGHDVIGIARGAMLEAIRTNGLRFRIPGADHRIDLPVFAAPGDIEFRPDDVIFLTMKSQDTAEALQALHRAGVSSQPIVCAQNGINNERLALRLFPNVYAMTVLIPADYIVPGEVACFGEPRHGICDIGRYPRGADTTSAAIAAALGAANFAVIQMDDVMRSKHGKLLENLINVLEAALGGGKQAPQIHAAVRAEAETVYRAAGITDWVVIGPAEPRRVGVLGMGHVEGVDRVGGSSTQSLTRGAGSIETDYLNGEIVLLGRLHGVPAPLNAALCDLSRELVETRAGAGTLTADALARRLGLPS
ncbi:MAG: ketopantoate reductase family protein [Hyphomicrobiales bacterium]|nr:MAG: ketopantoate reductase family protein [Hyphomicrobiales bacterium]